MEVSKEHQLSDGISDEHMEEGEEKKQRRKFTNAQCSALHYSKYACIGSDVHLRHYIAHPDV
eukprot:scaffold103242_cov22-Tisochrysis_lutea.AAC.2